MAENLNKSEVVAAVAAATGQSQASVSGVIDALFDTIASTIAQGGKVTIPGYLTAERSSRSARTGRNPKTGETIQIPAGYGAKLSAGSKLKAAVK